MERQYIKSLGEMFGNSTGNEKINMIANGMENPIVMIAAENENNNLTPATTQMIIVDNGEENAKVKSKRKENFYEEAAAPYEIRTEFENFLEPSLPTTDVRKQEDLEVMEKNTRELFQQFKNAIFCNKWLVYFGLFVGISKVICRRYK